MSDIYISCDDLRKMNLANYSAAKDFSKASFWYYTTIRTADKILESGVFRASSYSRMNDIDEAELHSKNKDYVHALCFCNSNNEMIPMWYLYSGILGAGVRLGLTPSNMLKFATGIEKVYPVKNGVEFRNTPLMVGKEIEIQFGWVFYRDQEGRVNYRHKWYSIQDYDAQAFEKDNYFIKKYSWEYEREFRIILINHTTEPYDALAIPIPAELNRKMKATTAPEVSVEDICLERNGFAKCPELKVERSKLKIRMNLLKRNIDDLAEAIRTLVMCEKNDMPK